MDSLMIKSGCRNSATVSNISSVRIVWCNELPISCSSLSFLKGVVVSQIRLLK